MQQPPSPTAVALPRYAEWLTTSQAAAHLGTTYVVVNSWIVNGIKTETGRIHLRASKVGGLWKIDPAAILEFVAASTAAALRASATAAASFVPQRSETEAERIRGAEAAMARLKRRGVKTEV